MTRVDFYVLADGGDQNRSVFACRLAEKALGHGMGIYIHTDGAAETSRIDQLLWTFRDGSFLPHLTMEEAAQEDTDHLTPVLLGHGDSPGDEDGLLINLSSAVPDFFSRFQRVAEIVGGNETDRRKARDRFRFYRDRGYELNTHNI